MPEVKPGSYFAAGRKPRLLGRVLYSIYTSKYTFKSIKNPHIITYEFHCLPLRNVGEEHWSVNLKKWSIVVFCEVSSGEVNDAKIFSDPVQAHIRTVFGTSHRVHIMMRCHDCHQNKNRGIGVEFN